MFAISNSLKSGYGKIKILTIYKFFLFSSQKDHPTCILCSLTVLRFCFNCCCCYSLHNLVAPISHSVFFKYLYLLSACVSKCLPFIVTSSCRLHCFAERVGLIACLSVGHGDLTNIYFFFSCMPEDKGDGGCNNMRSVTLFEQVTFLLGQTIYPKYTCAEVSSSKTKNYFL